MGIIDYLKMIRLDLTQNMLTNPIDTAYTLWFENIISIYGLRHSNHCQECQQILVNTESGPNLSQYQIAGHFLQEIASKIHEPPHFARSN